jgi:hypothetical protein
MQIIKNKKIRKSEIEKIRNCQCLSAGMLESKDKNLRR